jgi:branched-chain amino acid transport system ATP-binding protein
VSGPILCVRNATLCFGAVTAFEDVSFDVAGGELFAIIGPNGAGKTSLFNAISRVYAPTAGDVQFGGRSMAAMRPSDLASAGVARTFQNLGLFQHLSVEENVLIGRHHLMRAGTLTGGMRLRRVRHEERVHRAAVAEVLEFAGVASKAGSLVRELPYGIQKRVELARALAMEPGLLLLDEPVAGLHQDERDEVTDVVLRAHRERRLTVLLVEHDMGMVMRCAERVLVLDFGQVIAVGRPSAVQRDERVIRAYLGEDLEAAAG